MRRFAALFMVAGAMLLVAGGTASAKGDPQGPQNWLCFFDVDPVSGAPTWHCASPGVVKNLGGPSGPSLNFEGAPPGPGDPPVSLGPPPGTTFVGTENLIRIDVYGGQPCPTGTSGIVTLPFGTYWFCHHYGG